MFTTLRTAVIAGLVGLTALAAVPAKADGFYLQLGDGDAGVYPGESGRTYHRRDRYRDDTARSTVANMSTVAPPNARSTRPSGSACAAPASPMCHAGRSASSAVRAASGYT